MKTIFSLLIILLILSPVAISQERKNTATTQVYIPDDSVFITALNRYRKIRIYLPKEYSLSEKKYPVLYMHDGQNLFDDRTSYMGEWGVDEALDSLHIATGLELIVIGIDNGQEKRMTEYGPWDHTKFGRAEGPEYVKFIVEELKPMIDKQYRTMPSQKSTAIMGSSMGGLISHYAMIKYPQVFGKIGIFSPSYWYADEIWYETKSRVPNNHQKIHLLVGKKEGIQTVKNVEKMAQIFAETSVSSENMLTVIDETGEHNEKFWRKHFPNAVKFLFLNDN